jgi:hypothetical protein
MENGAIVVSSPAIENENLKESGTPAEPAAEDPKPADTGDNKAETSKEGSKVEAPAEAAEAPETAEAAETAETIGTPVTDPQNDPEKSTEAPVKHVPSSPGTGGVIAQFVIFPLSIVLTIVAIFAFFNWAMTDNRSYLQYLNAIDSGWESERWQAAYELQFRITDKRDDLLKTADVPATLKVFERSKTFRDKRVRPVLAILLGFLGDPAADKALIEALDDTNDETRINAVFSLGRLRSITAVMSLVNMLKENANIEASKRGSFHKVIAYSLGEIGHRDAIPALYTLLTNKSDDVRWNAALALARFDDKRALPTLKAMIDRRNLDSIQSMRPKGRDDVMVNALKGVRMLRATSLQTEVKFLASNDLSYRVREAALEVLDSFKEDPKSKTNKQ